MTVFQELQDKALERETSLTKVQTGQQVPVPGMIRK